MMDGGSLASPISPYVGDIPQCCPIINDLVMDVLVSNFCFFYYTFLKISLWVFKFRFLGDGRKFTFVQNV